MGRVTDRLQAMGLTLPAPRPAGQYVPAVRSGNLVFTSGAVPSGPGGMITGKVGAELDMESAQEAARLCVLNCLAAVQDLVGDLDQVRRLVKLTGFVNSSPGFSEQHRVMDGASGFLLSLFGKESGAHARSSVGAADLPLNIAVEVELVVEVEGKRSGGYQ